MSLAWFPYFLVIIGMLTLWGNYLYPRVNGVLISTPSFFQFYALFIRNIFRLFLLKDSLTFIEAYPELKP